MTDKKKSTKYLDVCDSQGKRYDTEGMVVNIFFLVSEIYGSFRYPLGVRFDFSVELNCECSLYS
jgi:hypothetical protein